MVAYGYIDLFWLSCFRD